MIEYTQGTRYALRFNKYLYKDILHDAYLHWYEKTGKNLFDESNGTICHVIKLTYYGYYINSRIRGRHFEEFDNHSFTTLTPEQQLIESEEIATLIQQIKDEYPRTSDNMVKVLGMKFDGYDQQEIAKELNLSKSNITYYIKNIRSMTDVLINSPFNANKLKIKKKITRTEYDKHKQDKYSEYVYDTDRGSDLNESYLQLTHVTENYGLLIIEGKRLDT